MKKIYILSIVFLISLMFTPVETFAVQKGMGVSPGVITANDLLKNIGSKHSVSVQRMDDSYAQYVDVRFGGKDARFIQGESKIFFDKGVSEVSYPFSLVPTDAATGSYSANIDFVPIEESSSVSENGLAVIRGVRLMLNFSVSDEEVIAYDINNFAFSKTEEEAVLPIFYQVQNNGNVEWQADKIVFTFTDIATGESKVIVVSGNTTNVVGPGENIQTSLLIDHQLKTGDYFVQMDIYYDGDVVASYQNKVEIYEKGTLLQEGSFASFFANKDEYIPGEKIKLTGLFLNSGEVAINAKMIVEMYSKSGSLLDTLITDEQKIVPGNKGKLSLITEFQDEGEFIFNARVEFGNQVTEEKTASVIVKYPEVVNEVSKKKIIPWLIGAVILLLLLFLLIRKRNKKQLPAPTVNSPLYNGITKVSGTSKTENNTLVEVLVDGQTAGWAYVLNGRWEVELQLGWLKTGVKVSARVRRDDNKDGVVNEKDDASKGAKEVVVTENMGG